MAKRKRPHAGKAPGSMVAGGTVPALRLLRVLPDPWRHRDHGRTGAAACRSGWTEAGRAIALALALSALAPALPITAAAGQIRLIRDAGIEHGLAELARPLLAAAALPAGHVRLLVVDDARPNAFVIDDRHIFLHAGMIRLARSASELQGVIGHEIAHIRAGHIARRQLSIGAANTAAKAGFLLSLALAAATGEGALAGGVAMGTSSSALGVLLAHSRAEEASADRIGLSIMASAGIDPGGAVAIMRDFAGQEALASTRQDPWLRSHPLSRDRLRNAEALAGALAEKAKRKRDAARRAHEEYWFARLSTKIDAFRTSPAAILRKHGKGKGEIDLLAQAIAHHRMGKNAAAQKAIAALLRLKPDDPYYHELKGQFFLERRRFSEAIEAYREAVRLAPDEPLIHAGLGRALLLRGGKGDLDRAIAALEAARTRDPLLAGTLRDLALAYGRKGQNGMAALVTAERYALEGRMKDAEVLARRAAGLLARGSPAWRRAQDVISTAKLAQSKRRRP